MQLDVESRTAKTACGRQAVIPVHEQVPFFGVKDDHRRQPVERLPVLRDSRRIKVLFRIDRTAGTSNEILSSGAMRGSLS